MSDRYGRKPLGTVARHPADWFSDQVYNGGFQDSINLPPPAALWLATCFFNNDQAGRAARVYGFTTINDNGEQFFANFVQGSIGTPAGNAASVRGDQGASDLQIFQQEVIQANNLPYPFSFGAPFNMWCTGGLTAGMYESAFPLAIIPAGFSLVLSNQFGGTTVAAFIRFQMANR